jgi:hypothetical protein
MSEGQSQRSVASSA